MISIFLPTLVPVSSGTFGIRSADYGRFLYLNSYSLSCATEHTHDKSLFGSILGVCASCRIISAVNCSSIDVSDADLNTTVREYGTAVNVSCKTGYQFDVDLHWIVIKCQANKSWSAQMTNCTREFVTMHVARQFSALSSPFYLQIGFFLKLIVSNYFLLPQSLIYRSTPQV